MLTEVIVQMEGLENVTPSDGQELVLGRIPAGSQFDITSLSLDSECYFLDQGGFTLVLEEQSTGSPGGDLDIVLRMEDTQCAVNPNLAHPFQLNLVLAIASP